MDLVDALRGDYEPPEKPHLTEEQVTEIRRLYASGVWGQQALADRFGVTQPYISRIVNHKRRSETRG